jgi:glycosyltransferase involved in cell wall biosynthesis
MRIVQIVTRRQRRGAEVFACQLGDELSRRGHEVALVGLFPAGPDPLTPARGTVTDLDGASGPLSLRLVRDVGALLRRFQPDLVQANGSVTLKYAAIAKRWSGGRWPLVYRNISIASYWARRRTQRLWGQWLMRSVEHVAAVSGESGVDFGKTYGVPESRITAIPIGVEIPAVSDRTLERERLTRLAGLPSDSRAVMHIGSFSPEKNHVWLLDAFRVIVDREPGARLVLVGDGALKALVESTIQELGLRDHVRLLGARSAAAALLAGADVFVLPSLIEGIPGVILEAAAQGVPTVATSVGSVDEAVLDGQTGKLVASGDKEGFVSAVVGLLHDSELRSRMGAAARQFAKERYDMAEIVSRFEALYERLSNGAPHLDGNGRGE